MKTKYLSVFLGMILSLLVQVETIAQHCLSFDYDRNGNRVAMDFSEKCPEYDDRVLACEVTDTIFESISLYPNPTNGIINLSIPNSCEVGCMTYSVYDHNAILRLQGMVTSNVMSIDIGKFMPGVYLLVINNKGESYAKNIVKL